MLEFAVQVKGLHDVEGGQATWVLAADPTAGVLIAHEDKTLHWHPLEDCTFVRLLRPDAPRPVFAVQPAQEKPPLVARPDGLRVVERNGA